MGKISERTGVHALLGASSSHRWLECTPSARAEAAVEDRGSDFAMEGSLAHAYAAMSLKRLFNRDTAREEEEIAAIEKAHPEFHTGEMDECVTGYTDYVTDRYEEMCRQAERKGRLTPEIYIEMTLDYSRWVREGFGTGDCVIIGEDSAEVIDFKYGKGVKVDATDNPQMKLYALGMLDTFDYAFTPMAVHLSIFQPRIGNLSTWQTDVTSLKRWGDETLRPLAEVAWRGLGARKSGEWCRFCKVKGDCMALASESLGLARLFGTDEDITPEGLAYILDRLGMVEDWVGEMKQTSLKRALEGESIPGYKIVEGKSSRKISDPAAIATVLTLEGYEKGQIFRPLELRTLTELEKEVGKKRFAELCGEFIIKPKGKPALAPDADSRRPLSASDDFEGM